ncbi:uncharacterized protein LOC132754478 isoform X2 [Ruditapes philippinarum]|uniref:uncharacterized protein LOC132754478 isoform X2 n=1 Tax=Ruditapes philippinarum TaxID=129788 RepID=UPI00295B1931|nr:uncharacterized protein LOC132754478 isoform X2 [Ruditapes philippinarum]
MTSSESVQLMAPAATKITLLPPKCPPSKSVIVGRGQLRVPRSVQLQLARSLTFGVLGDDSNLYPSSNWVSENRDNYAGRTADEAARTKPDFMITSLDTRKHNPQPTQIYHIRRINKQPVCNVQSWVNVGEKKEEIPESSVYKVSYQDRPSQPVNIVHKQDLNKPIEGIVPVNITGSKFDVRSEMMLPVCDASRMPSAPNPHRYLLRKRKVPPPFNTTSGIVYPNLEHSRMTSYDPGMQQTGSLPFPNESPQTVVPKETSDRTSVSSLSGYSFSRRKYIQPPSCHIFKALRPESPVCVSSLAGKEFSRRRKIIPPHKELNLGFDGGIAETTSRNFDDKYLPFIRAKTII